MSDRKSSAPVPKSARSTARKGAPRERAAVIREQQERSERRRRALLQLGIGAATLSLVVGIGVAVQVHRNSVDGPGGAPAGTVEAGTGFLHGRNDAKATVTVFEDFQCPACKLFEQTISPTLDRLVAAGTARVIYRPLAYLDFGSTTKYSSRSLNAVACAADAGRFLPLHNKLFGNQPEEGTAGLNDDRLIALGGEAGITGETFASCVHDQRYRRWVKEVTEAGSKAGVSQTPTVLVNGKRVGTAGGLTPQVLEAAVRAAAK